ncbi:hypothetical protein [Sphingobium sp. Leaf26]|uniref:hypothetical protein n=1 Tax=Sphingobium sp. Leaf26 TaxID=1735693 RepID=UPI000A857B40|nr:hypothetical protein [Sphingobium sp. Leaf26]
MSVLISLPARSFDEETITAADIVVWAKVERALSAKREACRKLGDAKVALR